MPHDFATALDRIIIKHAPEGDDAIIEAMDCAILVMEAKRERELLGPRPPLPTCIYLND